MEKTLAGAYNSHMKTVALLHSRLADAASRPGHRRDDYTLELVLGGGGQRGVFVSGFVSGLEAGGATRLFDRIRGCSAGFATAVYLAAGQAAQSTGIYMEDNCEPGHFVDRKQWKRMLLPGT
jgi:predicted acylesterase/phospholipase RssA